MLHKEEFEPQLRSARVRLEQLQSQIQSQENLQTAQTQMRLIIGSLDAFAQKVKKGLGQADFAAKREIICAWVKRVEVNDDQVRIVYRIDPGSTQRGEQKPILQHCPADA